AVLDRARLERRQVGPRVGLAEALAPDLVGGQDRRQEALLLLVGPPDHERGATEQQAEDVGGQGRARPAELLEEDRGLGERGAAAAVLARPVHAGPAAVVQAPLPLVAPLVLLLLGRRPVAGRVG